jgi:uncharacterized phiE125 gp8 family phage protein
MTKELYPYPGQPDLTSWIVKTQPAIEPVTLEEVKEFVKVDGVSEDALLGSMTTAARIAVENFLGRALIEQTILLKMDEWPGDVLKLPMPPFISITEVRTLDESDAPTIYAATNYYTSTGPHEALLIIKNGCTPPTNTTRYYKGYEVEYKAGYGATAASVPQPIKEAIKLMVALIYEGRIPDLSSVPPLAAALLSQYSLVRV